MPLSASRIHRGRETPYPWERAALEQIYARISDNDPHQAWELHELHDPSTGRMYELDLVFLSRAGLFLVEIKSHPGALEGDVVDWTFTDEGGHRRTLECPYRGANLKARILAGLMERHLSERPWVHAAVFVPNATSIRLEGGSPPWLLTPSDVHSKLVNGLGEREPRVIVNRPMMKEILRSAERLGLRASKAARLVGGYALKELIGDGEGYQEHRAINPALASDVGRIRRYLVPEATTADRREQLRRAARREAKTLAQLGQHPGILGFRSFVEDSPVGPAVLFEAFEDALPLHLFLRQNPGLTFDERLDILRQVVEAVAWCHKAQVLHRNLSPASVLVRRKDDKLQVRVHRFQTSASLEHSSFGTRHINDLAQDMDRLYQAPEVLADPDKALYESDVFSIGCLMWLVMTGEHPAATLQDRERRLTDEHGDPCGLKISAVRDDLGALDEGLEFATNPNIHERADDVQEWFDSYLLERLTRPDPEQTIDPRTAQKDAELPGGYKVVSRLGTGSTATVLHVRRDGRDHALKVPHNEECSRRLRAEAQTLEALRHHQHIVELREPLMLSGLTCLLLEFAGEKTLSDVLREEGALPLELARRYGDDLLSAVQFLEEQGITHRDIKPTNVGFTSQAKKQRHLLLLDFSLSSVDVRSVSAGTAEWRDPRLYLRGTWDFAADRWSAAAVLYFALTGTRPAIAEEGAEAGKVAIEAERFDAAVRDRLGDFFEKAFALRPEDRFPTGEAMRQAWIAALEVADEQTEGTDRELDLSQVRPETLIDALPLTARARNALDRAAVRTVAELLLLPRNQLSVIRGVGTRVAREIFHLSELLRKSLAVAPAAAFVPGFVRPKLRLDDPDLALDGPTRSALEAAGLTTTVDVALAPAERVGKLLGDAQRAEALKKLLEKFAADEPAPGSLADWARALVGRASENKANKRLRVLVGLDPFPDGRPDEGAPAARGTAEVAAAMGIEVENIHSSLQFLREKWAEREALKALLDTLRPLLDDAGPVATLDDLARALAHVRVGEGAGVEDLRNAAALIRVALEVRPPVAQWRRINQVAWIARDAEALDALVALAAEADELAANEKLPSSETVRTRLAERVEGTPLAELAPDRRVTLAAQASRNAAVSARLELYPKGLEPARAITLSLGALTGAGLTAEAVKKKVAARYPEAAPLPERPALDLLLAPHGFVFLPDVGEGEYGRPGQAGHTSQTAQIASRKTTAPPGNIVRGSPEAQRAEAFQHVLELGVNARQFRVIQVSATVAAQAAELLAKELKTEAVSVDHALFEQMRGKAAELGVQWAAVEQADREGPGGANWPLLTELVRASAEELFARLLSDRKDPLLLVWPGALARYELKGTLQAVVQRAQQADTPAVLLVVPSHANGLAPNINGRLPVPVPLPAQRLVMPEEWLRNLHRAAEMT